MAKKGRNRRTRTGSSNNTPSSVSDPSYCVHFKNSKVPYQVQYFFDKEDVFDPCIQLTKQDLVTKPKSKPPKPIQKTAPVIEVAFESSANKTMAIDPDQLIQDEVHILEDSVVEEKKDILLIHEDEVVEIDDMEEVDDEVGYMTAMGVAYVDDDEEIEEIGEFNEFEATPEETGGAFQLETAMVSAEEQTANIVLQCSVVSKEEFDENTIENETDQYSEWFHEHVDNSSLLGIQVTKSEFGILKKILNAKKK